MGEAFICTSVSQINISSTPPSHGGNPRAIFPHESSNHDHVYIFHFIESEHKQSPIVNHKIRSVSVIGVFKFCQENGIDKPRDSCRKRIRSSSTYSL